MQDTTFSRAESIFRERLQKYPLYLQVNKNLCCTDEDEANIKKMAIKIKRVAKYEELGNDDIYKVLIFIYYSLVYNEQTTDWLHTKFLKRITRNKQLSLALYFDITTKDIILNGSNLSSEIRRIILGLNKSKSVTKSNSYKKFNNSLSKKRKTKSKKKVTQKNTKKSPRSRRSSKNKKTLQDIKKTLIQEQEKRVINRMSRKK